MVELEVRAPLHDPGHLPGILCLDIEGGWGGSSRSLYYLIEEMDRATYRPVVLIRKDGPIKERYEALGVACVHMPDLPSFRPADRNNLISFGLFLWGLRKLPLIYRRIRSLARAHNVRLIHVNHESFIAAGYILSRLLGLPWVAHIRTTLTPGWFSRRLCRLAAKRAAHVICIVEPVRQHFCALAGIATDNAKIMVVHNILPRETAPADDQPMFTAPPDRFRVISLTNFSPNRGVDRIIDVADILNRRGDQRFAFYLCGKPANTNAVTGRVDSFYGSVRKKVHDLGLGEMVFFPGHVSDPGRALASAGALIKLTRQENPWGRDSMEALAAGVPVVTLGAFDGFIENGVNGYIAQKYAPDEIASYLQQLAGDPGLCHAIGETNKRKGKRLFDAARSARAVEIVYGRVLADTIGHAAVSAGT